MASCLLCLLILSGCSPLAQPQSGMVQPLIDLNTNTDINTSTDANVTLDAETLVHAPSRYQSDVAHLPPASLAGRDVPAGMAVVHSGEVMIATYPLDAFQASEVDATFAWPYASLDRKAFLAGDVQPVLQPYHLLQLENEYLTVSLLPELGGRIWQVRHKAGGNTMFYQNQVVKPSPWGPVQQQGWFGLGGIEWNLPVVEHGYDWGTPWEVQTLEAEDGSAHVIVSTPDDGRLLAAVITITLPADAAYVELSPMVRNLSAATMQFDYWQTAMLAPGPGNAPSEQLRFVLPGHEMVVHSTGDERMPAPQARFDWPIYADRDLSRLGNWTQYLGFFEYPQAHGPFAAVYDGLYDAGAVHIFPAHVLRGSKVFGLGWTDALLSDYYTDDGSAYVELHSGLAPTFFEKTQLAAGETIDWHERWYPVSAMGGLTYADADAALYLARSGAEGIQVSFYPVRPMLVDLVLRASDAPAVELARWTIVASPIVPFQGLLPVANLPEGLLTVEVEDRSGKSLIEFAIEMDKIAE